MTEVTQFCIGLENKPGMFARLCASLKQADIRIKALCVSDDEDCCWVNIVASPESATESLLRDNGYNFFTERVLALELTDEPARMEEVARLMAEADININYVYGSADDDGTSFTMFMSVTDIDGAKQCLDAATA
ncbi:MAG: hypothetical protein PVI86_16460 [Phycisphaerae bacterium]|jgi:hypothetical protein